MHMLWAEAACSDKTYMLDSHRDRAEPITCLSEDTSVELKTMRTKFGMVVLAMTLRHSCVAASVWTELNVVCMRQPGVIT